MFFEQSGFSVRFEWGECGIDALGPSSDLIVIVDVLSFSTCVDIATSRGAIIFPYSPADDSVFEFAKQQSAQLASRSRTPADSYSLSPTSIATIPPGMRLVLPSPNGSALCLKAAKYSTVITACLRNSNAVAKVVADTAGSVAVIACGERWRDGSLRPSWEDFIGAGAVISFLAGNRSPEAQMACDAFSQAKASIFERMCDSSSGRELIEKGFTADVELAAQCEVSDTVPVLVDGKFIDCSQIHK